MNSAEGLADVVPMSGGHVVVGVPPSDPPSSAETPEPPRVEAKAPLASSKVPAFARTILDGSPTTQPSPERPIEKKAEKPVDLRSTLVQGTPESARAPISQEVPRTRTLVDGSLRSDQPAFAFDAPAPAPAPVVAPVAQAPVVLAPAAPAPAPAATPVLSKRDLAKTVSFGTEAPASEPTPARPVVQPVQPVPVQHVQQPVPVQPKPVPVAVTPLPTPVPVAVAPTPSPAAYTHSPSNRDRAAAIRERAKGATARITEADDVQAPVSAPPISAPPENEVVAEKFFSEGDLAVHGAADHAADLAQEEDELEDKARRKSDPNVILRRRRFAGYVKIAVGVAAVVCLAAIGSSAFHARASKSASVASAAPVEPVKTAEPLATAKPAEPPPAAAPASAKPEEPKAEEAKPEAKPEEAKAEAPAAAEPSKAEEIAGDAKEELKKCRTALERGKIAAAIEAGEKSVALDPTDGEAWLLLGAAYQEKGDMVNARRAYGACLTQGKTGPRHECAKMPH